MTQPPPASLHSLYRLHGDSGQTEEEDMRLENRSRRQKKKGRRPSTEWTLAEGEREGGEGGLVNTAALPLAEPGGNIRYLHVLHVTAYISLFDTTHMILQYLLTLFNAISKCNIVPVKWHGAVVAGAAVVRGPEWPYPCPGQHRSSTTTFSR